MAPRRKTSLSSVKTEVGLERKDLLDQAIVAAKVIPGRGANQSAALTLIGKSKTAFDQKKMVKAAKSAAGSCPRNESLKPPLPWRLPWQTPWLQPARASTATTSLR